MQIPSRKHHYTDESSDPPQEPSQAPGEERGVTQLNTRMVALPEVLTYRSSGVAHR